MAEEKRTYIHTHLQRLMKHWYTTQTAEYEQDFSYFYPPTLCIHLAIYVFIRETNTKQQPHIIRR